jgi:hypothetical protein
MKINRDNYEAYFLDYYEGQLDPEMVAELMLFVELNPDLKPFLDDFELIMLEPSAPVIFDQKSRIKKNVHPATETIHELNCDEWFISEAEGLLSEEQISLIDNFVALNPGFEKDRRLYKAVKLTTDDKLVFANKEQLKQEATASITAGNYEVFLARELENDLSTSEKQMLSAFLATNPHLEKERSLYHYTVLPVDSSVVYPAKSALKQKAIVPLRKIIYYSLSAAASLIILIGTYFVLNTSRNTQPVKVTNNQVAAQADQVKQKVTPETGKNNQSKEQTGDVADLANNQSDKAIEYMPAVIEQNHRLADVTPLMPLQAHNWQPVTSKNMVDPQFLFIRSSQMYINQSRELYYNIKLEQQLAYAEMNTTDRKPGRTLLAALGNKTEKYVDFKRDSQKTTTGNNATLWTLAELGVQTLNTVTSSQLELNLRKDDEGKVIGYNLESGILDIEKDLKH